MKPFVKFAKKSLVFLLTFSLLASQFSFLIPSVYAASSPWTQTDWVGGSGQTSWSDATKYSTGSNITDSTTGQLTLSVTSGWCNNASCDSSWKYRKKITFNNTDANLGVTAENLVNFPVLVKLSSSNIDYTKTQDSGQDIRFTDTDGSDLAYEIEKWDETGTSWVWVKVPQIDINSSTDYVYLYYGNTSATDHQQATSVWDSNYKGVWHLPNGTTLTANDSTSNANNGTITGATATTGQIDGAGSFDGTSNKIQMASIGISGTSSFSISGWIKVGSQRTNYDLPLWNGVDSTTAGFGVGARKPNSMVLYAFWGSETAAVAGPTTTAGNWYHVTSTYDGSTHKFYVNGVLQGSVSYSSSNFTSGVFNLGSLAGAAYFTNDIIDNVSVSNTARSAAWIAASYKSETDAFNTFNTEEERYVSSGTLTSSIFDTEQQSNWGTLTYNTDGVATTTVKARTSNSSTMVGATDFASCSAITSGTDISSNNCVTDTHRYIQYQISLTSVSTNTPTFQDISIAFTASDGTAPSISLTALSPDPNSDNTPTLSGTATESIGTVSNVQFQMDSTSGSWTACTADDGSFDEATETFTCTPSALSDGSHTMYVRATDSNSNTTASGSESSDTFTIDATAPTSIDLDSPGDNNYTNNERPTFKWKATTDATAGLSKYSVEIDNPSAGSGQVNGDFTIDSIPTSGTTDVINNKYVIHFDGFSDSDATNNYISVYTKSTPDWDSALQNDGKLREGRISWKVKAVDNAGNETSSSRTLFVDRTNPNVEFTRINSTPFTSINFSTTDKTPTIFGKITDPLAGGDSSQTQSESGPKVASGPKEVNIKVEKKNGLTYSLVTLYKINMDNPYWTCTNKEITDNSKQNCDKYLPFEYTPKENLDYGTYKITLSGKDKADNSSGETTLTLNITTLAQITTPEEREVLEKEKVNPPPPEGSGEAREELEITKPVEPSALDKAGAQISQISKNILNTTGNIISAVFNGIGQGAKFIFDTTGKALAFAGDKAGQAIAFVGHGIQTTANAIGQGLAFTKDKTGETITFVGKATGNGISALYNSTASIAALVGQGVKAGAGAVGQELAFAGEKIGKGINYAGKAASNAAAAIGDGYNQLANNAPGVTKTILTGIGDGVSATASTIATIAQNTVSTIGNATHTIAVTTSTATKNTSNFIAGIANNVGKTTSSIAQNSSKTIGNVANTIAATTSTIAENTGSAASNAAGAIAKTTQSTVKATKSQIANVAFAVGERTQGVAGDFSLALIQFAYNFVPEPTKISDVQVATLSPTQVKITWRTNHPANGKVNYGLDETYPFDVQSEKRLTRHEFTINNLKPDTQYYFEVMSHNKNYVYDANRKFKTPAVAGATN